jgi:tRNA pseudouridine38-40 synthase
VKTWKLTLEYDGTRYSGWQEQRNARTVAGVLRAAAEDFFQSPVELGGAGRTDAGVHALGQVAHMKLRKSERRHPAYPAERILRELNGRLPGDVVVLEAAEAAVNFHARHDAEARSYLYQIASRKTAFHKKHVWWIKEELDVAAMQRAARMMAGRHDFKLFAASDATRPGESTIVVVNGAEVFSDDFLLLFRIDASHFLWRMVRRLVGVTVKIGRGELSEEELAGMLEGRSSPGHDIAAWTAPASGLFLESVRY